MDDRARAGVKMMLAGLTLSHQAAAASAEATERASRLKALQAAIEQASRATPPAAASTEATVTAGAARVAQTLADVAERARPKAEEMIESARKGIEKHGPTVEAAVKSVITEFLKTEMPGTARPATPPSPEPAARPAQQASDEAPRASATSTSGATSIAGHWLGTLRRAGTTDTLGCDLHLAPSGRPVWSYHDGNGLHQTELTHEGQTIQYVPPDRGVVTVTVLSVTGSSTETGYVVDYSFERSSNGYLTQRYQRYVMAGRLRGAQLDVTYSEAGISSFGDKTGIAAGGEVKEYSGSLIKQG